MSLPSCPYAKTPNFVLNLDESLGGKLNCWTGSGTQKRFYVTFIALILIAACQMLCGALIINDITALKITAYKASDIIRYVGDGLVILSALVGIGASFKASRPIMAGSVLLLILGTIAATLAIFIDASNTADLSGKQTQSSATTTGQVTYAASYQRALAACVFGGLVTIFGGIAAWLGWSWYQEGGGLGGGGGAPPPKEERVREEKPKQIATKGSIGSGPSKNSEGGWATKKAEPVQAPREEKPVATFNKNAAMSGPTLTSKPNPIVAKTKPRSDSRPPAPRAEGVKGPVICMDCKTEWADAVKFCGECGGSVKPKDSNAPPAPWEECYTDDGELYYYNANTDESKWPDEF